MFYKVVHHERKERTDALPWMGRDDTEQDLADAITVESTGWGRSQSLGLLHPDRRADAYESLRNWEFTWERHLRGQSQNRWQNDKRAELA